MRMFLTYQFSILTLLCISIGVSAARTVKVYLIGDSTMSEKEASAYPETGWGMPFRYFFDSTVVVDNRAQNGRSTRTFWEENRWQPVADSLTAGDYVLIQFGHNDEVKTKKSYTPEAQYREFLLKYVSEAKARKAIPILLTPVARRNFDSTGVLKSSHDAYSAVVRQVAQEQQVALIDLDVESQALYRKMGPEHSKLLFNQLQANEHPNYPDGKVDNTHFNELGARKVAEIVLRSIRSLQLDLANRIVKPTKK